MGDESSQNKKIELKLRELLERRGFIVSNNPQYEINLKYRTDQEGKKISLSLNHSEYFETTAIAFNHRYSSLGLGVSIAQAIGMLNQVSVTNTQATTEVNTFFRHSILIEIKSLKGEIIWQGESLWDSPNIDLITDITASIQILISKLPKNENSIPYVRTLLENKDEIFYKLYCAERWFSCPALPYRMRFASLIKNNVDSPKEMPEAIHNSELLPLYLDLVQTAEYVLPFGKKNYTNPMNTILWGKVLLGGVYKTSTGEEIKVLISMTGESDGYVVDKCWKATFEEYMKYESDLKIWQENLIDYYNLYEN